MFLVDELFGQAMEANTEAAACGCHGRAIKDLWLGGSAAVASGAEPLRVASANVLSSNSEPEKALDFVQTSDADVVVLVEAQGEQWRDVLAAIGADYPHRAPEG